MEQYQKTHPPCQQEVSASPPEGLTISEAAKLCPTGISEAQIRQAAATGRLWATKIDPPRPRRGRGRPTKILIDPADLAAFILWHAASKRKVTGGVAGGDSAADNKVGVKS